MTDTIITHYVELSSGRRRVDQRVCDGYIDATAMCKAAGKQFRDYYRLKSTKDYIEELSGETGVAPTQLVEVKKGNTSKYEQGTWVHFKVALHLGRWLSPKFATEVSKWNQQCGLTPRSDDSLTTNNQEVSADLGALVYGAAQFRCFALLYQDFRQSVKNQSQRKDEEWSIPEFSTIQLIHDLAWMAYLVKKEKAHKWLKQRELAEMSGITERALRNYSSRIGGWDNFTALFLAAQALDDSDESNNTLLSINKPYWSFFASMVFRKRDDDEWRSDLGDRLYAYPWAWDERGWLINWMKILDSDVWLSNPSIDHVEKEVVEKAHEMMLALAGEGDQ